MIERNTETVTGSAEEQAKATAESARQHPERPRMLSRWPALRRHRRPDKAVSAMGANVEREAKATSRSPSFRLVMAPGMVAATPPRRPAAGGDRGHGTAANWPIRTQTIDLGPGGALLVKSDGVDHPGFCPSIEITVSVRYRPGSTAPAI